MPNVSITKRKSKSGEETIYHTPIGDLSTEDYTDTDRITTPFLPLKKRYFINDVKNYEPLIYKAYWLQYLGRREEALEIIQDLVNRIPDNAMYHVKDSWFLFHNSEGLFGGMYKKNLKRTIDIFASAALDASVASPSAPKSETFAALTAEVRNPTRRHPLAASGRTSDFGLRNSTS